MSKTRTLPVLLLIVALLVPATLSGQVSYEVSDQKVVLDGQTYYMHLVLKDQTLYSIAKTYKVSIDAITANNVIPANGIQTDQVLRIPESAAMAATTKKPKPPVTAAAVKEPQPEVQPEKETPPPAAVASAREDKPAGSAAKSESEGYRMHKVKKGETLYSLSRDYRVTVEAIIRANDVPRNEIQIGQVLRIPPSDYVTFVKEETPAAVTPSEDVSVDTEKEAKTSSAETKAQPESQASKPETKPKPEAQTSTSQPVKQQAKPEPKTYHKVKKGESLSDIAKKYNVTVREIKDANEGLIFPMTGMKLVIPVKKSEDSGTEIKE
jgi:LysM repeat protein